MEKYQKMYLLLFNSITDSIESMEKRRKRRKLNIRYKPFPRFDPLHRIFIQIQPHQLQLIR